MRRGIQIGRNLALAAGLLSMSLALGDGLLPLGHVRAAGLNMDKVYRLDSLANVALAKGRHVASDLATLYKIRKLASAAPQPASSPTPDSVNPSQLSPPVEICSSVFRYAAKRSSH